MSGVRDFRTSSGLSQGELAELSGVAQPTIAAFGLSVDVISEGGRSRFHD